MRTLWRFHVNRCPDQTIQVPAGAKLRYCRQDGEQIVIWAEIQTDMQPEDRRLLMIADGDALPWSANYLGTVCKEYRPVEEAVHVYEIPLVIQWPVTITTTTTTPAEETKPPT